MELFDQGVERRAIGIVTPYKAQVKYIKDLFEWNQKEPPKIASVEEFQSDERDIILLSSVRSFDRRDIKPLLGFIQNPERINVAISRPRSVFSIVTNLRKSLIDIRGYLFEIGLF